MATQSGAMAWARTLPFPYPRAGSRSRVGQRASSSNILAVGYSRPGSQKAALPLAVGMTLPSLMNLAVDVATEVVSATCRCAGYHHPLTGQCSPVRTAVVSTAEGAMLARRRFLGTPGGRGAAVPPTVFAPVTSEVLYICRRSYCQGRQMYYPW